MAPTEESSGSSAPPDASSLEGAPCPACGAALARAELRWTVLLCAACGGVWADKDASVRIATVVDRDLVSVAKAAAQAAVDTPLPGVGARACPACSALLLHVRQAGVAVDVCSPHGTWFDRDELGRLSRNLDYDRKSMEVVSSGDEKPDSSVALVHGILER